MVDRPDPDEIDRMFDAHMGKITKPVALDIPDEGKEFKGTDPLLRAEKADRRLAYFMGALFYVFHTAVFLCFALHPEGVIIHVIGGDVLVFEDVLNTLTWSWSALSLLLASYLVGHALGIRSELSRAVAYGASKLGSA